MTNKYDWLLKKTPRSVDAMKLWDQNPRLNPNEDYHSLVDFADEITITDSDRKDFIALAKSIVDKGFIPADPVVLWQDDNTKKYYVAEGNRRILALKLLRNPLNAPKSIRATFLKLASEIDRNSIDKIPVSISPTFDDAEWYISQRNSISSLQRRWSSEQQKRWLYDLYEKYNGDIDVIRSKIDMTEPELQKNIRVLKLKNLINEVKEDFTDEEFAKLSSIRFPITNFERFFTSASVREKWGIEFKDYDYLLKSNKKSFLGAFTQAVKRMVLPDKDPARIDSRSWGTTDDEAAILDSLPEVSFVEDVIEEAFDESIDTPENGLDDDTVSEEVFDQPVVKDDPFRPKLIHSSYCILSDNARLRDVFNELKRIPFTYPNAIAASIRIFLDMAVLNFIKTETLETELCKVYKCSLQEVTLSHRLEFLKKKVPTKQEKIISKLLNPSNQFSLDVLNGYQHNTDNHYITKEFLNRFWNSLFPLVEKLVVINEA